MGLTPQPPDIQPSLQPPPDFGPSSAELLASLPRLGTGSDPGGTEDLENRSVTSRDMSARILQQTTLQNAQLEDQLQQTQQKLSDPLNQAAEALSQQYQALQNRRAGVRALLQNFFSGAGHAMMHEAGILTPEDKQQNILQNLVQVSQAQSLAGLRDAQTQNLRLVTRQMPDGSQIQIPQGHLATFDLALVRGYEANQKPPDLNDLIGRSVYSALTRGTDPNSDPVVKALIQVHAGMQKPAADTAAEQKERFMQGLNPAIAAGEITPAMLTDARQLVGGIQHSRAIPAESKPALVSYLFANSTPASQKLESPAANDNRLDHSYSFNSTQLEKAGQPIEQLSQRMGRLQDALAQGTPQADALIAPELLSVMAGGQGSGLRMNEAEISRIVGGRSAWESLKAAANKWSLDPSTANSITDDQRKQIRALVDEVQAKLQSKQKILDGGRQQLISASSVAEHRQVVANTRRQLDAIDAAPGGMSGDKKFGTDHPFFSKFGGRAD